MVLHLAIEQVQVHRYGEKKKKDEGNFPKKKGAPHFPDCHTEPADLILQNMVLPLLPRNNTILDNTAVIDKTF